MELKLLNMEGKQVGKIEVPLEEITPLLSSLSLGSTDDATLAEKDSRITELEGQVAELSSEGHKQGIVAEALEQLKDPTVYAEVGKKMGHNITVTEEPAEVAEESPVEYETMQGRGDPEEGWRYFELFGFSSRPKQTVAEE